MAFYVHADVLREAIHTVQLDQLINGNDIAVALWSLGFLTPLDKSRVIDLQCTIDQNRRLLSILHTRSEETFFHFCNEVELGHKPLADYLRADFRRKKQMQIVQSSEAPVLPAPQPTTHTPVMNTRLRSLGQLPAEQRLPSDPATDTQTTVTRRKPMWKKFISIVSTNRLVQVAFIFIALFIASCVYVKRTGGDPTNPRNLIEVVKIVAVGTASFLYRDIARMLNTLTMELDAVVKSSQRHGGNETTTSSANMQQAAGNSNRT